MKNEGPIGGLAPSRRQVTTQPGPSAIREAGAGHQAWPLWGPSNSYFEGPHSCLQGDVPLLLRVCASTGGTSDGRAQWPVRREGGD